MVEKQTEKTEAGHLEDRPSEKNLLSGAGARGETGYRPSAAEIARRNKRSLWIAFAVVGFILLVYLITVLRLGQAISNGNFPG